MESVQRLWFSYVSSIIHGIEIFFLQSSSRNIPIFLSDSNFRCTISVRLKVQSTQFRISDFQLRATNYLECLIYKIKNKAALPWRYLPCYLYLI